MKNILTMIIILSSLFIMGCANDYNKSQKKIPKTTDKILYIMISKYSSDGNKSIGANDTIAFKPDEKATVVEDILKIFDNKEPIKNEAMEKPEYKIVFLYNLDPRQSKVREEFLESDIFELVANKEYLLVRNEKTKELFKIQGADYNKLILYMKLVK
ncbi:hypothetical protein [Clostridium sp. C8-1-8]|uniref:hypothetical protein n=1 Tax=Clostridium sp. C8-1-8 TaxID=2698831 RepID=UPI001367CE3F|nr:hypothetical protein [Clostridium sp. C8-1-8]